MSLIERAKALRATIEGLAVNLNDDAAAENVELFPAWSGDGVGYLTGDRVRYEGILYKVLMDHTSQADWTPTAAPSLFAKILIPDPEIIPVWIQPDSTNCYQTGDKVYYPTENDHIYVSLVDNNSWPPTVASCWAVVEDEEEPDPEPTPDPEPEPDPEPTPDPEPEPTPDPDPEPEPTPDPDPEPEPTEEIPEWSQPDSVNPFMKGDKVRYNGKIYESVIDNNVWSPDAGETIWKEVTE